MAGNERQWGTVRFCGTPTVGLVLALPDGGFAIPTALACCCMISASRLSYIFSGLLPVSGGGMERGPWWVFWDSARVEHIRSPRRGGRRGWGSRQSVCIAGMFDLHRRRARCSPVEAIGICLHVEALRRRDVAGRRGLHVWTWKQRKSAFSRKSLHQITAAEPHDDGLREEGHKLHTVCHRISVLLLYVALRPNYVGGQRLGDRPHVGCTPLSDVGPPLVRLRTENAQ